MVPDQMTIWRRDQGGQAAHKVEWIENQTRDTPGMRPWAPQLVGDATIGAQAEPFLGEGRPQAITAQTLQSFTIPGHDVLCAVEREAGHACALGVCCVTSIQPRSSLILPVFRMFCMC